MRSTHDFSAATPAVACGMADHVWSIGELIDAALAIAPDDLGRRRKPVKLIVIDGGRADKGGDVSVLDQTRGQHGRSLRDAVFLSS